VSPPSSNGVPRVSVCVSTRNRAHRLPSLLQRLEAQTLPLGDFEVVIVDDGSTNDTWPRLQSLAAKSSLQLQCLRNGRRRGAAAGRNVAWRTARAALCAFTDDDCLPTPGWLSMIVEQVDPDQPVLAAGAVLPPPGGNALRGPFARVVVVVPFNVQWCATANLVVRRADLDAVGGFDEVGLATAAEDTDLGLRVQASGSRLRFLPDALVYHPVEIGGFAALWRDHRRYVDLPLVFAKSPWARERLLHRGLFWKRSHPAALAAAVGLLFRRRPLLAAALAVPWLHERLCADPVAETFAERLLTLPGVLLLDLHEVATMVRGSVKHRVLVL
jgi:GT2 family glycosyltransferase